MGDLLPVSDLRKLAIPNDRASPALRAKVGPRSDVRRQNTLLVSPLFVVRVRDSALFGARSMKNGFLLTVGLIVIALALGLTLTTRPVVGEERAQAPTGAAAPALPTQPIEPHVEQVLSRACSLLSSHKMLSYHAEITFDSVLPSLVKLQYSAAMDAAVERPNRLAISYQSDLGAKRIWYNGQTLTIFDPAHMAYASIGVPDTIDAMLAQVANEKNLSIPLKGFDVSDPCEVVHKAVLRSKYVGLNDAGGVDCDHLAFIQQDADWQLWIEHGKKPVPRKIVITYKKLPTQPQWEAVISDWRFDHQLANSFFQPQVPKAAIKTDFIESKEK